MKPAEPPTPHTHTLEHTLEHALEHGSHLLPDQGPIGVFVHHNTLHAFQHLPFHEAVLEGARTFGAKAYMSEERFRQLYAEGRIRDRDLEEILAEEAAGVGDAAGREELAGLTRRDLWRLWLKAPIDADTAGGLAWRLAEGGLATTLPASVQPERAQRLLKSGEASLRALLQGGELGPVLRALVGQEGAAGERAFFTRFGLAPSLASVERLLRENPQAPIVAALWETARRRAPRPAALPKHTATPHAALKALLGEDPWRPAARLLTQLAAIYLDEGLAAWPLEGRERGMLASTLGLLLDGPSVEPWVEALHSSAAIEAIRAGDHRAASLLILREWGLRNEEVDAAILEILHVLPGWAGMFARLERNPLEREHIVGPVHLADYTATALVLFDASTRFALQQRGLPDKRVRDALATAGRSPANAAGREEHLLTLRLFLTFLYAGVDAGEVAAMGDAQLRAFCELMEGFDVPARQRLWQEAYERHHEREALEAISANRRLNDLNAKRPRPRLQAVFCIDDREESLRRMLEERGADVETYGAAGFFGLAIAYKSLDQPDAIDLCPVGVTPAHEIHEIPMESDKHLHDARVQRRRMWARLTGAISGASRSIFGGSAVAVVAGPLSAIPVAARIIAPGATGRLKRWASDSLFPTPQTQLTVGRAEHTPQRDHRNVGYTPEEQIERIAILLENIGVRSNHARLFLICGHGSSSQNNPHRSAYDCGACSGKHGDANARLMAAIGNDPAVRAGLAKRGIEIPEDTWFIGCLHNTSSDEVKWFDLHLVPDSHKEDLRRAQEDMNQARAADALERCRRFVSASGIRDPLRALRHAEDRAEHIAEPRPECGHATNAMCIVGRRALTRGLFLDRRAFLTCYDPHHDEDVRILERLLAAVGPVGAGISLEYYFSYVDNERYGCGTKLPHNVTGMIGVINGAEGDLRTGLPWQMVEIHEPIRLLVVVESTPERILKVAERQPVVRELVVNAWIRLAVIDPDTGAWHVFRNGGFQPWTPDEVQLRTVSRSADWTLGQREHLPPARVTAGLPA